MRLRTFRLLAVASIIELSFGVSFYAFPEQFTSLLYEPLQPSLPYLSVLFLLGGVMLVDRGRLGGRRRTRFAGAIVAALPLLVIGVRAMQAGVWSGVIHYGALSLALLCEPWVAADSEETARGDYAALVLGLVLLATTSLLLLDPDSFGAPAYLPVFQNLPLMAALGLSGFLFLFFEAAGAPMSKWHRLASRLMAAAFPALLAYNSYQTSAFTGFLSWGIWTAVALFAWRPAPAPARSGSEWEGNPQLTAMVAALERWPPYMAVLVAGLSALGGSAAVSSPLIVSVAVVLLTTYGLVVRHVLPNWGTPSQRALAHLSAVTIIFGVLFGGMGPLGISILVILVVIPLLGARYLGASAARCLFGLVIAVVLAGEFMHFRLGRETPWVALGGGVIEAAAVAIASAGSMRMANQQRRLIDGMERARADLELKLHQAKVLDEIVHAIRRSLDMDEMLSTAAEQVRQAFGVPHCNIRLSGSDGLTRNVARGAGPGPETAPSTSLSVPIRTGGGLTGAVELIRYEAGAKWTETEVRALTSIADHIGMAVVHAQVHAALAERHRELKTANEHLQFQREELRAMFQEMHAVNEEMAAQQDELHAQNEELMSAQSALRASEARFAGVLGIAGDAIISVDPGRGIVLFNQAAERMFGYTQAEVLERPLSLLIASPRGGRSNSDCFCESCLSRVGETITDLEVRARRMNGAEFPAEASVSRMQLGDENLCTVILRDISARRQAEKEVREAHELKERIFGASPAGVLVYDSTGRCVAVNRAASAIVGAEAGLLVGQNYHHLESWKRSGLYNVAELTMQTGIDQALECQLISSFGRISWVDCRLARFTLSGEPHLLLIINDVTQRKLAEQELQFFFSTSVELLCLIGVDGYFRKLSPTWSKTFGWTAEELKARPCIDFIHPEDREPTREASAPLRTGGDLIRYENRFLCKDGSYRRLSWNAALEPVRGLIVAAAHDVTEQRRFEDQLRQARDEAETANRAKGEFLANMSHEIRTPLNAVIGFSELLQATTTDGKQKGYLEAICTAGRSLLSLIGDILDLSKAEAGLMELQPATVLLSRLFGEIETIFRPQMQDKGLQWSVFIADGVPPALILDEQRLRQVLLNLVGNAVKFTPKGYVQIAVRAVSTDPPDSGRVSLIIDVEDSGIGIPETERQRVFAPFRQRSGQSTRTHGGTGLGLTISRRLVELMDGTITLESEPGHGSCFTVTLRDVDIAQREADPAAPATSGAGISVRFGPARALVADAEESNRLLLRSLLEGAGLEVIEAEHGPAVLQLAQSLRPDVIVMDMEIPVMDGAETAQRLRSVPNLAATPIIALTAAVPTPEPGAVGVDALFAKPFSGGELLRELARHLPAERPAAAEAPGAQAPLSPEAASALQVEVLPVIAKLRRALRMTDVQRVAAELMRLDSRYGAPLLGRYGKELLRCVEAVDVIAIQGILRQVTDAATGLDERGGMA